MTKINRIPNSRESRLLPIETVKPYARHARRHSKAKIGKLKKLLGQFGQVAPILVDGDNVIISGHALHTAMRELGAGEIAAVSIVGRSESEIKALRLALNRLPLEAAWDDDVLRAELQELVELSFDLDPTGFDPPEIDSLLDLDLPKNNLAEDDAEIPPIGEVAISAKRDIWVCGRHRLGCGDALDQGFVDKIRGSAQADVCFIDPPYNVPIVGFASGKGRTKHHEFVQAAGEMSSAEFIAFLTGSLKVLRAVCTQRALIYACMDWRHSFELIGAGRECGLQLFNLCVWAKTNAGMGSLYRSQHELVCVFKAGSDTHENDVELGRHGRNRSNLWTYRGFNTFGHDRDGLLASHPTVKPVSMIADALRDVTKRGGIVIDSFMGSGSTLMAAEETGRICFGTEIDPLYVDVAIRRWQARTARDAIHAVTGELFSDRALADRRGEGCR
jgi:DNA modification methylase